MESTSSRGLRSVAWALDATHSDSLCRIQSFPEEGSHPSKLTTKCRSLSEHVFQKNPRAHKNKIGTPPPKPKIPPLKQGILWTWRFSCRRNTEILGAHKIGAAISGPRIADKNFTDTSIFQTIFAGFLTHVTEEQA